MDKPVKILIVDDSAFNRRTLTKLLESIPGVEIVGTAANGSEGLKQATLLNPDLITLDLDMPVMDGFTFLRIIMKTKPIPVIVISSRDDDVNVFKAMEFGAVDFIPKPTQVPSITLFNIKNELIRKVKMIPHLKMEKIAQGVSRSLDIADTEMKKLSSKPSTAYVIPAQNRVVPQVNSDIGYDVIVIGSSTGGPPALTQILPLLPEGFPVSVVISQHMPPTFTKPFAERLNKLCKIPVREAENNKVIKTGEILIAPGGRHIQFKRNRLGEIVTNLVDKSDGDKYVPSVDMMFASAALMWGKRTMAIVLTGMGHDGKEGVTKIKEMGGYIIAESEETAIVFGMPQSAIETGVVDEVIQLYDIGAKIIKGCFAG